MPAEFSHGNQAVFSIDSTEGGSLTDISEMVSNVTFKAERDVKELKRIGGNAAARLVGPVVSTFTLDMFFDAALDAMFITAMDAASPVTRTVQYGPEGNDAGSPRRTAEVWIVSYENESDGDNPNTCKAELAVDGSVTNGTF